MEEREKRISQPDRYTVMPLGDESQPMIRLAAELEIPCTDP